MQIARLENEAHLSAGFAELGSQCAGQASPRIVSRPVCTVRSPPSIESSVVFPKPDVSIKMTIGGHALTPPSSEAPLSMKSLPNPIGLFDLLR